MRVGRGPRREPEGPLAGRAGSAVLSTALALVAVGVAAAWLFLAVVHVDDRYRFGHLQGVWAAVARAADHGLLYPPLFDGAHYGGTRWMPLPILLNATAARLTGEYAMSGKLVGLVCTAALLALVVWVVRRAGCPWPLALALAATVVATEAGLQAGTTVGGDVLPVLLQLGALAVVTRGHDRLSMAGGGVLAGLAAASKLTGVWAALAVGVWLVARGRWRSLGVFAVGFVGAAVVALGAVQLASDGRLWENLSLLAFAGVGGLGSLARAPNQVLYNLSEFAQPAWALLPLAALATLDRRGWNVYQAALTWALVLLLAVYTDIGTGFNQLLDVVVLTAVVVGHLAGRMAATDGPPARWLTPLVALAIGWAAGTGLVLTLFPDVRTAAAPVAAGDHDGQFGHEPVLDRVGARQSLLSEDPYVPVALGRRPVVLDPFMLLRIGRAHPEAVDALVARVDGQEFDVVALIVPLASGNDDWWANFHFGTRVADALRRSYRPTGTAGRYFLYRPKA